ncbi:MAG TPA: fumarylacetoacetate hydrolase family protein [Gemmatimonadaceae bacterium]|nr:fumarylacetoacetate hydrolase family protein [Gemmatimonadaceae bacterium]
MKLALYTPRAGGEASLGIVVGESDLVDAGDLVAGAPPDAPQRLMTEAIDVFERRRGEFERAADQRDRIRLDSVELLSPLPRPGKILCCIGNYWEHAEREPKPLNMFLKNPDAVIGPGGTVRLPSTTEPWIFMHEAELALVVKGPAKDVPADRWQEAIFGYTCMIDVTARGEGRMTWRAGSWMGKSFDTFGPLGPVVVTADEIPDPNDVRVRLWDDGELRHDYSTDDMEHRVPEIVEFASSIMTLHSGDVIACGTNHEGLGAVQHGDELRIEIAEVGSMSVGVVDPLERSWPRGVYMGADSTNHEAVRQHDPQAAARLRPSS